MSESKTRVTSTATDARNNFSELVARASYGSERIVIERRGRAAAAIVSADDLEILERLHGVDDPAVSPDLPTTTLGKAAENLFGTLFRRTNHPDGRITFDYVSGGAIEIYGVEAQEIMDDPQVFFDLMPDDTRQKFLEAAQRSNEKLERFDLIFRIIRRDGEERWIKSRATPSPQPDGRVVWHGVAIDITEQQRIQIELTNSRAQIRDFAEAASDYFWETGPDHRFRPIGHGGDTDLDSGSFETGFTPWELAGVDPDADPEWRENCARMDAHKPFRDFRVSTERNGKYRHWSVSGKPIFLPDGAFDGYRGTTRDITKIVEAERRADSAEVQLGAISHNIPGVVYRRVRHPDGRIEIPYVSEGAENIFGIDAKSIIQDSRALLETLHPDDREVWFAGIDASAETLQPFDMELRFIMPTGEIKWSRSASRPRKLDDGTIVWDGFGLDITEQKTAEEEVSDLSSRLGNVLDETPMEFYFLDPESMRILDANRFACESIGYTLEELRELTPADLDPEFDKRRANIVAQRGAGTDHVTFESTMRRKDGSEYPVELRVQPTKIKGKTVLFVIAQNIEARRARERERMSKTLRVRALNHTLMELATSRTIASGDIRAAAREITVATSGALELQRASVWLYTEDRDKIICQDLFLPDRNRHYVDLELERTEFAPFFDALERDRTIAASDATNDPRTAALAEKYLIPLGVTAMLEVPIRVGGEVVGVACHEVTTGHREWSVEEQNFVASIGDLLAVAVQASRRRDAEEKIRLSEERFRDVAEIASDWFWEMDKGLRFTYISDRVRQVGGIVPSDIIGRTRQEIASLTGRTLDQKWRAHLADLDARKPFRDFRYGYEALDGSQVNVSISGKPLFSNDGEFLGYRGTGTNITAEVEAASARRRAQEQAELANRAKSEFLANMSHELRTPLNAIIGFSEILENETFGPIESPQYRGYVGDILESGRHLLSLINDILDLSKVEAGKLELRESEISLDELLSACKRLIQPRIEEGGLQIEIVCPNDLPMLVADGRNIKQVVLNLLSNAVKFSNPGGKITASAALDVDGGISLTIEDTGIGISPNDIERIMVPFEQAASSMTRHHEGSGLGLPLAKSLIELHDGTLELASEPGTGTRATIKFPPDRTVHHTAAAE